MTADLGQVAALLRGQGMSTRAIGSAAGVDQATIVRDLSTDAFASVESEAVQVTGLDGLMANVHSGLTVADEATLFDKLNRQRKQITTWDHWRARRAADDPLVHAIEATAFKHGLRVHEQSNKDGVITCCSTLEKIATSRGGPDLLDATLRILGAAWGNQRDAYDAPIVLGVALVIYTHCERLQSGDRLIEALTEWPPRRIRYTATAMRDTTPGSLAKLIAITILNLYNKRPGPKLTFPTRWVGTLPKAKTS